MSWVSGADLADELWRTVCKKLKPTDRILIARAWVDMFESRGCDSMLGTIVGEDAGTECTEEKGSYFPWQEK